LTFVVAVAAAVATAWLLARTPPFLPPPRRDAKAGEASLSVDDRRLEQHRRWFAHMRWAAALLALVLALTTVGLGFLPEGLLAPLLATIGAVAASNLVYAALDRRRIVSRSVLLAVQLNLDLGFLVLLLHLSGGIESPLYLLPVFNVLLGGIVLTRRQCFFMAWTGGLVCGGAACAEWARLIPHFTLAIVPHGELGDMHEAYDVTYTAARSALQLGMMLLTAHFVSRLAEQSRAYERDLAGAAEEARAGRELLEQALENSGVGLRVLDDALQPLFVSEQWRRWFPLGTAEERTALTGVSAPDSALRRTLADSSVQRSELVLPAPGAAERSFAVTTAPLHDPSGRTDRAVELVQDVTAEKEIQRRVSKASKLAVVGEVAGKLAHEINNPTAIISAKGRLLLSDRRAEMSPKVAHEVERIVDLADRVAGIAKGLLAYGRPSAAPRAWLDPALPVRRALSLVQDQANRQGVRIADQMEATLPSIDASAPELEQVFLNLFLNALDFMPEGGVLAVTARPEGAHLARGGAAVEIVVADTGPGIPADVRERVFEPFFTTKEEGRGTGLGLAVCQGVVRGHGGEMEVEAKPGYGARFAVRLPILATARREIDG
jgi:signal transduction histidine kinase